MEAPNPPTTERIKLNVGGKLFETTVSTIRSGGSDSLLSALSVRTSGVDRSPIFIDRDPEIFSVLLSLLRSGRLPSTSRRFTKQELADEALYYGVESCLRSAASPLPLSGIDASMVATVRPASDGFASAFAADTGDGSLWIAHGGQISSYDWNLVHAATVRTHLDDITAISRVRSEIAAIGSDSAAGLHFHDLSGNRSLGSVQWRDPADPRIFKARVAAIAGSSDSDLIFASFHCPHKENSVLAIDKSTLQIRSEIGRQRGSSAKSLVPGKLTWLPERGLLVGSSITCGAFGFSGYVRLWDPRSGDVVWETNEPGSGRSGRFGDPFADVAVDVGESTMFKVCSKSGDLGMADLRKLCGDPWIYLQEKNLSLRVANGVLNSTVIHCYKGQVFVGREGSLEVWSMVPNGEISSNTGLGNGSEVCEGLYRRNFVDKDEDCERGVIEKIECGGDRLFISRRDCEGIEVWESSNSSSVINL